MSILIDKKTKLKRIAKKKAASKSYVSRFTHHAMRMKSNSDSNALPEGFDLTPYAGRWVAIVRGCITGVGLNANEARLASKYQRPKEEPMVIFVPEEKVTGAK